MDKKRIWIAEIGQNHNGQLRVALALARKCINAGVDYVKFQAYDAQNIFDGSEPFYFDSVQAELTRSQVFLLASAIKGWGGRALFSVFDTMRLSWVVDADMHLWPADPMTPLKLASRVADFPPLVKAIGSLNKSPGFRPFKLFVSHGMKTFPPERYAAIAGEVVHLFCKAEYPTTYTADDWARLEAGLKSGEFAGISDHSVGTEELVKALELGVGVVEKHITFDRRALGPDHKLSLLPEELAELIKRYE